MVKTGSPLSFARGLQRADRIRLILIKSSQGRRYGQILQQISSEMGKALQDKNYFKLLAMEKIAVQRDFREYGTKLAQKSENGHKQIMERWKIGCDPDKAREDFRATYAPENLPKAKVMDTVMESLIKTQCRRLSDYAKGNTSAAEKLYFTRRAECLKAVYKEHMRHLEQALGLGKETGKGLER